MKRIISAILAASLLTVSLSANASAIDLRANQVYTKNVVTYNSLLKTTVSLEAAAARSNNTMYLYSPTRNIKVITTKAEKIGHFWNITADKQNLLPMYGGSYEYNEAAISGLYNVERAYDNFKALGFQPSGTLYVAINSEAAISYGIGADQRENAWVMPNDDVLFFGIGSEKKEDGASLFQGCDLDIVTHEYMHYVTISKLGWFNGDNEAQAVAEAYSDVMAECMSANPDWKIGTKSYISQKGQTYCVRDIAHPEATVCPNLSGNFNYSNFFNLRHTAGTKGLADHPFDVCSPGEASTILSHAAYLMYKNGISTETLKKIWFKSLDYYDSRCASNPDFMDCKKAVCNAAYDYLQQNGGRYYYSAYLTIVNAFTQVGL